MKNVPIYKKFFSSPIYYSFLLVKRIKIKFHNKTEKKVSAASNPSPDNLLIYLWQNIFNNLKLSSNGHFFSSNVTNKNSPMVLSQARVILILCNNKNRNSKFNSRYLIKSMTEFLISLREKERGLFKFNQASWDLQDEGIASVWATLALIKAYEYTKIKGFLDEAISTMNSMISHIYSTETSLLHTEGENIWCLNSASTFADACAQLLKHYYSEEIKVAMEDSLKLCIDKIADDGHYPYNQVRQGTYLLLYHPIVMITLNNCLDSEHLSKEIKEKIICVNNNAKDFLIRCIDSKNRIFETEIFHYEQYIITNITSLLALKNQVSKNIESSLLSSISSHFNNNKLYLCKGHDGRLFDSDLYQVSDVLGVEVLYWLDLYLSSNQQ